MLEVIGYVVLGLFLLMAPGFLFSLILYPKLESLDFWSRMGVSLGLGVMLLLYAGYFLARPELAMLQLGPFVGLTFGVCAVLAIVAYFRGGFNVLFVYLRPISKIFKKFKPLKPPKPPVSSPQVQSQDVQKEGSKEQAPPPEQTGNQPPEQRGEVS